MPAVFVAKKEIVVQGESHMTRLLRSLSVFVLVLTFTGLASGQSDARIGTWKLNVAKSKFDPAAVRKSETRTWPCLAPAFHRGARTNLGWDTE